jgi:hypothetical protein
MGYYNARSLFAESQDCDLRCRSSGPEMLVHLSPMKLQGYRHSRDAGAEMLVVPPDRFGRRRGFPDAES